MFAGLVLNASACLLNLRWYTVSWWKTIYKEKYLRGCMGWLIRDLTYSLASLDGYGALCGFIIAFCCERQVRVLRELANFKTTSKQSWAYKTSWIWRVQILWQVYAHRVSTNCDNRLWATSSPVTTHSQRVMAESLTVGGVPLVWNLDNITNIGSCKSLTSANLPLAPTEIFLCGDSIPEDLRVTSGLLLRQHCWYIFANAFATWCSCLPCSKCVKVK